MFNVYEATSTPKGRKIVHYILISLIFNEEDKDFIIFYV